MKKLITTFILILFLGCDKSVLEIAEEEICKCFIETTIVSTVVINGVASTSVSITRELYTPDCFKDGDILYQDNNTTKIVHCE